MARRKGFLAEYNRQIKLAEKRSREKRRAQAKAQRDQLAAQKRAARQYQQMVNATIAEQKAAEKEQKRLYVEARQLEVEHLNSDLEEVYEEIDSLLRATLEVDDFVELETLRQVAVHPPFPRPDLQEPVPIPQMPGMPSEPTWTPPGPSTGLTSRFDNPQKQQDRLQRAQVKFHSKHTKWRNKVEEIHRKYENEARPFHQAEKRRLIALEEAQAKYAAECQERSREVEENNEDLDALIIGLKQEAPSAIEAYVDIVLSNSVYPSSFPVTHSHSFDAETGELIVDVLVPEPDSIPTTKEYKYVKASDEIRATNLPKARQKERYSEAIAQVAVRTMHEIYEADRYEHIQTIALTVGVECIDPGTGLPGKVDLVGVASERVVFCQFDLKSVVAAATLKHLGAEVSSNMFGLKAISNMGGVRVR